MIEWKIIIAAIIIIGFIIGIRLMQRPDTALWGNRLGALCMFSIIILVLYSEGTLADHSIWLVILVGGILGIIMGQLVKMIQMPQMVALLNGFGGGASAIIAASMILMHTEGIAGVEFLVSRFTGLLALSLGTLTFVGSMVAALKLQGWINQKPVLFSGQRFYLIFLLVAGVLLIFAGLYIPQDAFFHLLLLLMAIFVVYGVMMAIRVGGADMPIIISFFNSLSGVAAAICGMTVGDLVLVGVGSLVGMAGLILTQIMCRAMNRNLASVLGGFKSSASIKTGEPIPDAGADVQEEEEPEEVKLTPEEKISAMARDLEKVIIVPGYGMALAQAQHQVAELIQTLERQGKEIKIGIHPVAGRMPGHMHVLLAEVGVPYEQLYDMEAINPEFKEADLVVIVGACDVVNPAANTAEGTPIYGMPVLDVNQAKNIVVCNLNEKPGYSGVDNTLYREKNVITIWGNAMETVPRVTSLLRAED